MLHYTFLQDGAFCKLVASCDIWLANAHGYEEVDGFQAQMMLSCQYRRDPHGMEQWLRRHLHGSNDQLSRAPSRDPGFLRYLEQHAKGSWEPRMFLLRRAVQLPPPPRAAPVEEAGAAETGSTFFGLRLVHVRTGVGVSGAALAITLGDGTQREAQTDSDGRIRIDDAPPGTCKVTVDLSDATLQSCIVRESGHVPEELGEDARPGGDQPRLAAVRGHRVGTGETLESIAEFYGLTHSRLCEFNWGTTDSDAVDTMLRERVGCRAVGDDGRPALSDSAEPGIVWVPQPLELNGLDTGREHEWLVRPAAPLYVALRTEDDLPIPEASFEIEFSDGTVRSGRLTRSGVGVVADPPPGWFLVRYPDAEDVFHKGIAAHLRHDFGQETIASAFDMLALNRNAIRRTIDAYDEYYNDFGGDGFVKDLRSMVDDQEVLSVVDAMLAGVGITGTAVITVEGSE